MVTDSVPAPVQDWRWSSTGSFFSSSSLLRDLCGNDVLADETGVRGLLTPYGRKRGRSAGGKGDAMDAEKVLPAGWVPAGWVPDLVFGFSLAKNQKPSL